MEEVELNGKKYVLKKDFDAVKIENEELKEKKTPLLNTVYTIGLMAGNNCLGMGSVKLGPEYRVVRISFTYLKQITKILDALFNNSENDSVDIALATDKPCIFGYRDKDLESIGGVILAPIALN